MKSKYKNPYAIHYNPYSPYTKNKGNGGYGTYGYTDGYGKGLEDYRGYPGVGDHTRDGYMKDGYMRNGYSKGYVRDKYMNYKGVQVPVQYPTEDFDGLDEMDRKYMKKMYPEICKKIQYFIDEECDKMEYDGSYMYDEYPEREAIDMLTDKIYEKVVADEKIDVEEVVTEEHKEEKDVIESTRYRYNNWLRNLVNVMLLNEIYARRRRRGRRRRRRLPYYDGYNYGYGYNYNKDYNSIYPYYFD